MSRNGKNHSNMLQEEIRKQFGSSATTRFVRSLSAFQVDYAMPERFSGLLLELDRAEADRGNSGRSGENG